MQLESCVSDGGRSRPMVRTFAHCLIVECRIQFDFVVDKVTEDCHNGGDGRESFETLSLLLVLHHLYHLMSPVDCFPVRHPFR
jgi:hypothetical protein